MTTLALIPARAGSKGVPGKNLRRVGGRTLVERAVTACVNSGVVDHVLVSTDDEAIAEEARRAGAQVPFLRPKELATDEAAIVPTIEHALLAFEDHARVRVTTLIFTEPTLPFRSSNHIRAALLRFRQGDCRSVVAVCPLERKPQNIFTKTDSATIERFIKEPKIHFQRRQDMGRLCRLSSGAYVVGRDDFLTTKCLIVEPIGYTEMTGLESVNIDEEIDLLLAQLVAKEYGL